MTGTASEIIPHNESFDVIAQFEEVLRRNNITWEKESVLEGQIESSLDFFKSYLTSRANPINPNLLPAVESAVVGLQDFAIKTILAERTDAWPQLVKHLKHLVKCSFNLFQENARDDTDGDKAIEYYLGCILSQFCDDLSLDHPRKPKGDNPDILFTWNGERVGIACKTIHSVDPGRIRANIEKSIQQIQNSEAAWGFPVISLRNVLKSSEFWGKYRGSLTPYPPISDMLLRIDNIETSVKKHMGDQIGHVFGQKKCRPYVLFISHMAARLRNTEFTPSTLTRLNSLVVSDFSSTARLRSDSILLQGINEFLQLTR